MGTMVIPLCMMMRRLDSGKLSVAMTISGYFETATRVRYSASRPDRLQLETSK